jgi:hypothetical protein
MILCSQTLRDDKIRGPSLTSGKRIVRDGLIFFPLFKDGKKSNLCKPDALQMYRRLCRRGVSPLANAFVHIRIGRATFIMAMYIESNRASEPELITPNSFV